MLKQNLLRTALFLPSAFIIFLLLLFWFAARNEVFAECGPNNLGEYCEYRGDNWCCGVGYCNQVSSGVCATDGLWPPYYFCEGDDVVDPSRGHDPCVWACGCRPIPPTPTPTDEPTPTPTPEPTATPIPPTPTPNCGQWGPCGSCDSCIGPDSECVFHRKDANEGCEEECLWDYAGCHVEGPTSTPTPTPTPGGPTNTPTPTPTPTGAPNTISGNVYNDPSGDCTGTQRVNWSNSVMKLDNANPGDSLSDGAFSFTGVAGVGHGLWIHTPAGGVPGTLPSGWGCPNCDPNCRGKTGISPGVTNFYVNQRADAWFQTKGGDVHGQTQVRSPVPTPTPQPYFSENLDNYPGVVSYGTDYDFCSPTDQRCANRVSSKGWLAQTGFNLSRYDYNYFYQKLGRPETSFSCASPTTATGFYKVDGDCTLSGGSDLDFGSNKVVVFVTGNLRIERNIKVGSSGFIGFIVQGNIEVSPTVGRNPASANRDEPNLQGLYLANGTFDTNQGDTPAHARLVGRGIFKAQNFILERDLGSGASGNGQYSAELFIFDPNLVLNSPRELWVSSMSWLEVAP